MLLFSDLHLSPTTLSTCMKVLRHVHAEALRLNTTIGFLGDFFDRVYNEGTLPVDILNGLMRFFSEEWCVPMIMIPGNHDYFDASETEHGLSPFQYASTYIRILDEPTMIGTQLWVPWRRDTEELKRILDTHSSCTVIFGHFDIVGFKLNASRVSTEGLAPSIFPEGVPVYTGHYHTPQVHGNIRYLGSPYQLSLSEAEDEKSLLVLDQHCHVSQTLPLHIGRKQYKWTTNELVARAGILCQHDRVSIACSLTDTSVSNILADLKDRGVHVQIRRLTPEQTQTRVQKQKDMSPRELLSAYAARSDIDTGSAAWIQILAWVKEHPSECKSLIANAVIPMKIEISGLGPFKGPVTVSMQGDGFTLVSGECNDTKGSSNGAGKSIVTAGAWLWACTGQIDGRGPLAFDSDTSVIHKGCDTASVSVSGLLEGAPWKIMRSLSFQGRQRKHHLRLFVNHIERTRSTLSGTQRAIASELFGLDLPGSGLYQWLLRNSVWSQQSVSRWLDANDTQAKQEIHTLANMEIWESLSTWCRQLLKDTKEELVACVQSKRSAKVALDAATLRYEKAIDAATSWQTSHCERLVALRNEITSVRKSLLEADEPESIDINVEKEQELARVQEQLEDTRICMAKMMVRSEQLEKAIPSDWLHKDITKEEASFRQLQAPNMEELETHKNQCAAEKKAREIQLENKRKALHEFHAKGECAACGRAFDKDTSHHNHLRTLQEQLDACRLRQKKACQAFIEARQKHLDGKRAHNEYKQRLNTIQNVKAYQKLVETIAKSRDTFDELSARFQTSKERMDRLRQKKSLYDQTQRLRAELSRTIELSEQRLARLGTTECPYDTSSSEKTDAEAVFAEESAKVQNLRIDLGSAQAMQKWSGPRGIQTYAMENTVQRLAVTMTQWLRRFYNDSSIQMKVHFDEKERLKRFIDSPHHTGVMSGGQWRRAQLASFMAWREMSGASIPLLILDEACTSMDADGIQSVQQTLRDWCEEDPDRTCFFISHEPEQHRDTSVYQHHLKILHKRGRSYVVDESRSKRPRNEKK